MSHYPLSSIALVAISLGLVAGRAVAADLDPTYAQIPRLQEEKVEFGSGWYVRGDIGATRLPSITNSTPSLPAEGDTTVPNAPTVSVEPSSRAGYVASLGGGYQFTNWIRADLIADFHQPIAAGSISGNGNVFCPTAVTYPNETISVTGAVNYGDPSYANGACTGYYKASLKSYDVLFNSYVDLGTWHNVTPYVGAGVGLSFGHYQTSSTYVQANNVPYHITYMDPKYNATFAPNYDRTGSGSYYNLAWALMAGISLDVADHTKVDVGYRYLNLGSIPGVSGNLTSQEVRVGLRYLVDN